MYDRSLLVYCKPLDVDQPIYVPKCLVILSQWPFHDFFRDYLCQLVDRLLHGAVLPLERCVCQPRAYLDPTRTYGQLMGPGARAPTDDPSTGRAQLSGQPGVRGAAAASRAGRGARHDRRRQPLPVTPAPQLDRRGA